MKAFILLTLALTSLSVFADNNTRSPLEKHLRKFCRGEVDGFGITKACMSQEQEGRVYLYGHATTAGAPRALFLKVIDFTSTSCVEINQLSNWDKEVSTQIKNAQIFKTPQGDFRLVLDENNGKIHGVDQNNQIEANNSESVSCSDYI